MTMNSTGRPVLRSTISGATGAPLPLVGRGWGGGPLVARDASPQLTEPAAPPPTPAPPHKGEGFAGRHDLARQP
jgi:hypothetical protein